jgi:S1-C subfamily serine protease
LALTGAVRAQQTPEANNSPADKVVSESAAALNSAAVTADSKSQISQESLPDLIRRVKPSVVSVLTYDAKGEPLISGSGFFIRPGEVVTNVHVIRGARRVEIHTLDGQGRTYPVLGALAIDEEADLALLSVNLQLSARMR